MRKPSISELVFHELFPPWQHDTPSSFASFIARYLVPEVRIETRQFYGVPTCLESQYPALDYCRPSHRLRLGRFPNHARLFAAFDSLGLTEAEIGSLCRWEGTRSARERYERDTGIRVRDTTGDDVRSASPLPPPTAHVHTYWEDEDDRSDSMSGAGPSDFHSPYSHGVDEDDYYDFNDYDDDDEDDNYDVALHSYGVPLNQRLLAAASARAHGANVPIDEAYERWVKETTEQQSNYDPLGPSGPLASHGYRMEDIQGMPIPGLRTPQVLQSSQLLQNAQSQPLSGSQGLFYGPLGPQGLYGPYGPYSATLMAAIRGVEMTANTDVDDEDEYSMYMPGAFR